MSSDPTIHRFPEPHDGALVNAYLVETRSGVVAVDGLLTVPAAREMRAALDRLGKPLRAALLTHSHPDHYAGLGEVVGPMFGDEWPSNRVFPNTPIEDGESVTFDGVTFTVIDLGPSESPHDSPWVVGPDARTVFLGDQIYDHTHCYLADGFYADWLANIERLRGRFPDDAVFHIGHGGPVGPDMWDWQRGYIEAFLDAVSGADWSEPEGATAGVVARMKEYEPSGALQFLMELSIEPVAAKLGLVPSPP